MYQIQMRKTEGGVAGKWVPIWNSGDGPETCKYLRGLVEQEHRKNVEYRMLWLKEAK